MGDQLKTIFDVFDAPKMHILDLLDHLGIERRSALRNADLRGMDFRKRDLSFTDLSRVSAAGAHFQDANLFFACLNPHYSQSGFEGGLNAHWAYIVGNPDVTRSISHLGAQVLGPVPIEDIQVNVPDIGQPEWPQLANYVVYINSIRRLNAMVEFREDFVQPSGDIGILSEYNLERAMLFCTTYYYNLDEMVFFTRLTDILIGFVRGSIGKIPTRILRYPFTANEIDRNKFNEAMLFNIILIEAAILKHLTSGYNIGGRIMNVIRQGISDCVGRGKVDLYEKFYALNVFVDFVIRDHADSSDLQLKYFDKFKNSYLANFARVAAAVARRKLLGRIEELISILSQSSYHSNDRSS